MLEGLIAVVLAALGAYFLGKQSTSSDINAKNEIQHLKNQEKVNEIKQEVNSTELESLVKHNNEHFASSGRHDSEEG